MKLAILYNETIADGTEVFVQYEPEVFRSLLVKHFEEVQDVGQAFDRVVADLKQSTKYK